MKKLVISEYKDYKLYLKDLCDLNGQDTRGYKQQLANYIQCQPSYLSQVFNGKPHLTLEQAVLFNQFVAHDKYESHFFILLLEHARAGSKDLRDYFKNQMEEVKKDRFHLKNRLIETDDIPMEAQNKYYSAWFYSAIHVILSIPEFQNAQKIADHFNLPLEIVTNTVSFLEEIGLIENIKGTYKITKKRIHLDRESISIQHHHINWRSQALQSVEKNLVEDFHYSNVIAIAEKDYEIIKEIFVKSIESARAVMKPSKEEKIYALTVDFFKI